MRIVKGFRAGLRVGRSLAVQCRHAWHVVRGHMIRCVHKAWEVGIRLYPIAGKHARALVEHKVILLSRRAPKLLADANRVRIEAHGLDSSSVPGPSIATGVQGVVHGG